MKIDTKFHNKTDHLLAEVTGEYDLNEAAQWFALVLHACSNYDKEKVLVDFRKLCGMPKATEKMLYAMNTVEKYFEYIRDSGMMLKVAYLGNAPHVSTFEPGLDHAKSLGIPVNVFTDEEEARTWLGIK